MFKLDLNNSLSNIYENTTYYNFDINLPNFD